MNLTDQVISLSLAKSLKELGVKQNSVFWWEVPWQGEPDEEPRLIFTTTQIQPHWANPKADYYAAFTVAELGKLMKETTKGNFLKSYCEVMDVPMKDTVTSTRALVMYNLMTDPDIAGKMLSYFIENNLLTP